MIEDIACPILHKKKRLFSETVPYPFNGNELSASEKIALIERHFREILIALGMDIEDDSLQRTPERYAKMFVNELFQGLKDDALPKISSQENKFHYNQVLLESKISIHTICEHHFMPILGYCHIAYIPQNKVIGLSKLNRIARYFAKRPQVQERLTKQISVYLKEVLETEDVAIVIDALHLCVRMRGIQDEEALTRTYDLSGCFLKNPIREEFFTSIPKLSEFRI